MLVLSRNIHEKILIGDDIIVVVVGIRSDGRVKLGIEAPDDVAIDREEVRRSKDRDERLRRLRGDESA